MKSVTAPQNKSKTLKKKTPGVQPRAVKSNMRAIIAAARKKQLEEGSCG